MQLGTNDTYQHLSDQALLERFYQDHDNQWLGILLQRYTLLLYGVCMKYLKNEEDARDSVQQVFLKVITELHKYKVAWFKSWLYMVAKNHCLMKLRDAAQKTHPISTEERIAADNDFSLQQHIDREKVYALLEESLESLNEEQKQSVRLFYLQKKTYQEIADITGYTLLQVKSFIQNGKRNLKIMIEKKLNAEENK